jgi:predicted transcriptional regulator
MIVGEEMKKYKNKNRKTVTIRLDEKLIKKMDNLAQTFGIYKNDCYIKAISEFIKKQEK